MPLGVYGVYRPCGPEENFYTFGYNYSFTYGYIWLFLIKKIPVWIVRKFLLSE